MKLLLFICSLLFVFNLIGQDYNEYHRILNRIDKDVLNKDYFSAVERYDSLYENFNFIYSQHCFKALQICCISKDSLNVDRWLEKSIIQGVPIWMIRNNDLSKKVFDFYSSQKTIAKYDSLRTIYLNSINHNLRKQIDSLFEIDQKYTTKVNTGFILFRNTYHGIRWFKNNKKQFNILNGIIDRYGFPGEKIIGLPKHMEDSTQYYKHFDFYGPVMGETKTYVMLIHYYSNPRADINNKLLTNVKLGNLPAYQFGALNDFMARWGRKKYGDFKYFNVWHNDPNKMNEVEIAERRNVIGLNSFEQQKINERIGIERRKNKKANSEIILE